MCIRDRTTTFDGVVTPLKIDISTGDAITPREVRYSFKLMLEDRSMDIWAYNLETVLAEKLETIITRTTTNTRMKIQSVRKSMILRTGFCVFTAFFFVYELFGVKKLVLDVYKRQIPQNVKYIPIEKTDG